MKKKPIKHKTRHDSLSQYEGRRIRVRASITRHGSAFKDGVKHASLLLHDVEKADGSSGRISDHIWIRVSNEVRNKVSRGDVIEFDATVQHYEKNYNGRDKSAAKDLGLFDVDNVEVISSWND